MRSALHPARTPRINPFVHGVIRAVSDIACVFLLLGELIAPRNRTARKTDHSEPPDVGRRMQPA